MISVCIATYNGEQFIADQLKSILTQLSPDDEVVVSDDHSTDQTLSVVHSLHSPIIKIVKNKGEHGYTSNFENALKHAHGDVIFLSDQDDIWSPNKVSRCLEHLKQYDMVISDAQIVDEHGEKIADSYYKERGSRKGFINNLIRFSYLGCSMAFRREILSKALPFPANHRYCTHDNWLGIVGYAFFKVLVTDEKLFFYRRHSSNTSKGGLEKTTSFWFKVCYRLYLIKWLLRRI